MLSAENRTSGVTNNRPGSGHGGLVTSKISSLIQEAEAKSGFIGGIGGSGGKRKSSAGGGVASNENLNLLRRQSPLGSEHNSASAAAVAATDNVPKLPPKPGTESTLRMTSELKVSYARQMGFWVFPLLKDWDLDSTTYCTIRKNY